MRARETYVLVVALLIEVGLYRTPADDATFCSD
jgi:hypothetical protein